MNEAEALEIFNELLNEYYKMKRGISLLTFTDYNLWDLAKLVADFIVYCRDEKQISFVGNDHVGVHVLVFMSANYAVTDRIKSFFQDAYDDYANLLKIIISLVDAPKIKG